MWESPSLLWNHTHTLYEFLSLHSRFPVIAITGVPWVGKSSIAEWLAQNLWATIFTEQTENNKFLSLIKQWVSDITTWGNNQNYFLTTDVNQVTAGFIQSQKSPVIFDFTLTQPYIFADMQLSGTDWWKSFTQQFDLSFWSLPQPDIILELTAWEEIILNRLNNRGTYIDDTLQSMISDMLWYYKKWIVPEIYNDSHIQQIQNILPVEEVIQEVIDILQKNI